MGRMIDITEGEAEYFKYRFKQYLGSVSRAIQNKRLKEQKMGMSIDDSKRYLRLMLGGMEYAVRYWKDSDKEESDIEQTNVEAVKTALETMRKYQKIQEIVKNTQQLCSYGNAFIDIRKVIEDGSN